MRKIAMIALFLTCTLVGCTVAEDRKFITFRGIDWLASKEFIVQKLTKEMERKDTVYWQSAYELVLTSYENHSVTKVIFCENSVEEIRITYLTVDSQSLYTGLAELNIEAYGKPAQGSFDNGIMTDHCAGVLVWRDSKGASLTQTLTPNSVILSFKPAKVSP